MEVMKQARHRAIRDLIEQRPIKTQQELAAALRERGFRATQATISRDVAELELAKGERDGRSAYVLPPRLIEAEISGEDRLRRLFGEMPVELREAGLLLIVRTLPGSAHPIAAALDRARRRQARGSPRGRWRVVDAVHAPMAVREGKRRLGRLSGQSVSPSIPDPPHVT